MGSQPTAGRRLWPSYLDGMDAPCSGAKCVRIEVLLTPAKGTSMSEITVIGLDLAKRVFQVHGADGEGRPVLRKRLQRGQVLNFFANLSPCLIGLEACAGSHYWGASCRHWAMRFG